MGACRKKPAQPASGTLSWMTPSETLLRLCLGGFGKIFAKQRLLLAFVRFHGPIFETEKPFENVCTTRGLPCRRKARAYTVNSTLPVATPPSGRTVSRCYTACAMACHGLEARSFAATLVPRASRKPLDLTKQHRNKALGKPLSNLSFFCFVQNLSFAFCSCFHFFELFLPLCFKNKKKCGLLQSRT